MALGTFMWNLTVIKLLSNYLNISTCRENVNPNIQRDRTLSIGYGKAIHH